MQEPISTTTKRYNSVKVDLLTGFESVSFGHDRGPGRGLDHDHDHDLHLAFECIAEHNVQPVSYTHLTLPTMLEV